MSEPATLEIANDIATITMDDGKANAFGPAMISALHTAFDVAERDAKAVILTGRPGVFSAGFDLKIMRAGPEAAAAMVKSGAEFLMRLYLHPQPVVAGCTGHAIAAGALLLLCSDHRIGQSGEANIGLNETSIGMVLPSFGLEVARDRLLLTAHASALLGATLYSVTDAARIGYLDEVADEDRLRDLAFAKAEQLSTLDPRAYAATKLNLRQATVDRILPTIETEIKL